MAFEVRRVVTGHDAAGKAVVVTDEIGAVAARSAEIMGTLIWTTEGFPVDNDAQGIDGGVREGLGTTLANGTVFRVVSIQPGNRPIVHRTESIDYAVIMSGELDVELDDGAVTHLKAGDVVVQRGTTHAWANRGTEPCVVAFVLIDAKPVEVGGQTLRAFRQ